MVRKYGRHHGVALRVSIVAWTMLLAVSLGTVPANSVFSTLKSAQSNPVLPVVVDTKHMNLVLTTDIDGILLCKDRSTTLSPSSNRIDYDYARKLLRYQLSGVTQLSAAVDLEIPSLGVAPQRVSVGVFFVAQQSLSPTSLAYYLHHSNADGFIGLGFAFRLSSSAFWPLLQPNFQYRLTVGNASSSSRSPTDGAVGDEEDEDEDDNEDDEEKEHEDKDKTNGRAVAMAVVSLNASDWIAGQDESEQTEWDWSEPSASLDQADDLGRANNQGLTFPIHHVRFQCTQQPTDATSSPGGDSFALHDVDMFGDFTSSWDVAIDFNAPCLVLPQQFYNSLAGWTGLVYSEDEKVSKIDADILLPTLSFALTHQGPKHVIDLNRFVLGERDGVKTVCIQQTTSIVHNGASVFAPIDTESSAQRYRLHGTMVLPVYNMQQTPIVFGMMALGALEEMIVDGEAKQIAFPHPNMVSQSKFTSAVPVCKPTPECIGQQEYSPRLNACLDPNCDSYYFQSLDSHTKVCVIELGWLMFLYTTLAVFGAAELLLSSTITRTLGKATTIATDT